MSNRRTDLFLRFFYIFFSIALSSNWRIIQRIIDLKNVNSINLFGFKLDELGTLFLIFSDSSRYIFIFINLLRLLFEHICYML